MTTNLNYGDKIFSDVNGENDSMTWIAPEYSKKAVGRAGDTLINPLSTKEQYSEALIILNNWRASHAFPLNSLQSSLRYRAEKVTTEALISQRLKRASSITGKLHRFPDMKLNRMQDIGGCRAVVPTISEVYKLRELMIHEKLKSKCTKENDYIKNPKPSGYRGIHLIYKYESIKQSAYNGHLIEVQIRSLIQHAWATSVEIAETFLGDSLKAGQGSPKWLRLFRLISILFSHLEDCIPEDINEKEIANIREETISLARELSISEKLRAFSVITKYGSESNKSGYFLLILDSNKSTVSVNYYEQEDLPTANQAYYVLESMYKDSNVNIVLVAAESMWSLRKAYPNYFADSKLFLETLDKVLIS